MGHRAIRSTSSRPRTTTLAVLLADLFVALALFLPLSVGLVAPHAEADARDEAQLQAAFADCVSRMTYTAGGEDVKPAEFFLIVCAERKSLSATTRFNLRALRPVAQNATVVDWMKHGRAVGYGEVEEYADCWVRSTERRDRYDERSNGDRLPLLIAQCMVGKFKKTSREEYWTSVTAKFSAPPVGGDGTFIVGRDIQPGTYRAVPDAGDACSWARLRGFGGVAGDIIASDTGQGPQVVTIESSDAGFQTRRCNRWTPIE